MLKPIMDELDFEDGDLPDDDPAIIEGMASLTRLITGEKEIRTLIPRGSPANGGPTASD
jgi:hypothetical protein